LLLLIFLFLSFLGVISEQEGYVLMLHSETERWCQTEDWS
jgi:hypothetical protein